MFRGLKSDKKHNLCQPVIGNIDLSYVFMRLYMPTGLSVYQL